MKIYHFFICSAFSLNGELMMDPLGLEIAFKHIKVEEGKSSVFLYACSL